MALHRDWNNVKAAGSNSRVPAGGYVLRIIGATNHEREEYLEVVWDIAEGEHAGAFANVEGRDWAHSHRIYHSEKCERLFKRWLDCVADSNASFNVETWQSMDEIQMMNALIGKVYGAAWNDQHQLKLWWQEGDAGKREFVGATFPDYYKAQDIRDGNFDLPKEEWRIQMEQRGRYTDTSKEEYAGLLAAASGSVSVEAVSDTEDVPF